MKRALLLLAGCLVATSAFGTDPERTKVIGSEVEARTETPHPVPSVDSGHEAWRDVFTKEGASYIAVHFQKFDLAPGERVVVQTPDGKYGYSFEGEGKAGSGGTFWATHVPGDTCEVVYYGNGGTPGFGYIVDKFAQGFPHPAEPGGGASQETICGEDDGEWAKCFENTEPEVYQRARAVVRLSINGIFSCTGWLVGCEGHVMTNAHCITNPADAMNTDFEFMAEGPTCETACNSSGACPGIIEASSSELISTGTQAVLDYSLVLLPTNLSPQYGFFRLRASGAVVGERMYIPGHPAAWGKQVYFHSDDASDEGFCKILSLDEAPAPGCSALGPPDVGYMCDSQSGSSGSPVVAYGDQRVIVLHHCSGCPNRGVPIQNVIADIGENLPQCALGQPDGRILLGSGTYGCSSTVSILVQDDDLTGAGTQAVTASSLSEPGGENVLLTENPPSSGTFSGSVTLTINAASGGDGLLSVNQGDTVTVVYIDADDGAGGTNVPRTATAGIDCVVPVISDVAVQSTTGDSATITWTTNEPATSVVSYGLVAPPSSEESDLTLVTSHSLTVGGLTPCTNYVFSVSVRDAAGNLASDNNEGAYYTFTTGSLHVLDRLSTDTPVAIPDNDPAGVSSEIAVTDNVSVTDVNVEVNITHPFTGDLQLYLVTPTGEEVLLSNMRGDDGDNYTDTVFDDEAATSITLGAAPFTGSFRPERPLSAADGLSAVGTWGLRVADMGPTDIGTLENWTLSLRYTGGCGASVAHDANDPADTCSGTGGTGGNDIVEPGESVVLPVVLRNDGTTGLTGVTVALSTTTPGVTVTRSIASYPNLSLEASAQSDAPHFAFTVASDVACGTAIDFFLNGSSNEGTFSDQFSVPIGAPGIETTTYVSTEVPRPLPDTITVTSTVTVADTRVVRDVDVTLRITHMYVEDLDIFLVGPNGTRVALSTDNGGTGDNYTDTTFDDEADRPITGGTAPFTGRYRPEAPLTAVDGIAANGVWTLEILDDSLQDPGLLEAWSLTLTTGPDLVCGTCSVVAPTAEVVNLRWLEGPKNNVEWDPAAGGAFYNLYRGDAPNLPALLDSGADSCLRLTSTDPASGETLHESPTLATFYWYLVRAANAGGEGPAGSGTAGPRRQDSIGSCP